MVRKMKDMIGTGSGRDGGSDKGAGARPTGLRGRRR
jgi:hypothetical protein